MSRTQIFFAFSFLIISCQLLQASEHAPYADFGFQSMDYWKSPTAKETEKRSKEDGQKPKCTKPSTPTRKQLLPANVAKALMKTSSAPAIVSILAASAAATRTYVVSPTHDTDYADFYLTTPKHSAPLSNSKPKAPEQDLEKVAEKD